LAASDFPIGPSRPWKWFAAVGCFAIVLSCSSSQAPLRFPESVSAARTSPSIAEADEQNVASATLREGALSPPVVSPDAVTGEAVASAVVAQDQPAPSSPLDGSGEALPPATYLRVDQGTFAPDALSDRFSRLQPWQCRAELRRRKLAVRAAGMPALGVASPVRIAGALGQIRVVTPGSKSVYGILDCRLLLLLAELEPVFVALSVREVYVDNFYRPKAHLPGKKSPSQHSFGLAIDIHGFGLTDGTVLNVEADFHGEIGGPVCGAAAAFSEITRKSVLLRNIVCELSMRRAFNYLLTPNHDTAHRNHLHGDIKRGAREHIVR
jgi:hypothetical protein